MKDPKVVALALLLSLFASCSSVTPATEMECTTAAVLEETDVDPDQADSDVLNTLREAESLFQSDREVAARNLAVGVYEATGDTRAIEVLGKFDLQSARFGPALNLFRQVQAGTEEGTEQYRRVSDYICLTLGLSAWQTGDLEVAESSFEQIEGEGVRQVLAKARAAVAEQ